MGHIRILCTGDLHLGRISSKCSTDGESLDAYSVRTAWKRVVECAIAREAHLVLLSGDIADDGGNQYEAMGPFEAGMARLANQGIDVFLVTGNHDAKTLPLLAKITGDKVRLLGAEGTWEQAAWPNDAAPQLSLTGWSYPKADPVALPVAQLPPRAHPGVPRLALAHANYRGADYAAVKVDALQRADVDGWLLGHLHAPERLDGPPLILNPGSPQALDPGEPGIHGPWLLEIADGRIAGVEQIPLSTVAYYAGAVDVTAMTEEDELADWVLRALEPVIRPYRAAALPRLSCRIRLTGRTALLHRLTADCALMLREQPLKDREIYLDRLDSAAVGPALDLPALCQRPGIIGTLATLLDELERGETTHAVTHLRRAEELVERVAARDIDGMELPDARALLLEEARRLLDALLRQEGARS